VFCRGADWYSTGLIFLEEIEEVKVNTYFPIFVGLLPVNCYRIISAAHVSATRVSNFIAHLYFMHDKKKRLCGILPCLAI
jgi:hypothetical protein